MAVALIAGRFQDGAAITPAKSYLLEPGLGAYRIGAANEGFAAGGALRFDYNTTRLKLATTYQLHAGSNILIGSVADKLNAAHLAIASQAVGDVLYADSTTTFARLAAVGAGQVLTSTAGPGAPAWSASPTLTNLTSTGVVTHAVGSAATPAITFAGHTGAGFWWETTAGYVGPHLGIGDGNAFDIGIGASSVTQIARFQALTVYLGATTNLGWCSSSDLNNTVDLTMIRDAADTLALRRSTNAQAFKIYNTYASGSDYETAFIGWSGNTFTIQQLNAGSGVARDASWLSGGNNLTFGTGGASKWRIASGSLVGLTATGALGYTTGAGGTVTQATSKSTGVTLNTVSGQITMNNAALGAGTKVSFVVTDSAIAATDNAIVSIASGGTANAYRANVTAVAAGSFTVTVENITAGSLSEAPVVVFSVVKGATS